MRDDISSDRDTTAIQRKTTIQSQLLEQSFCHLRQFLTGTLLGTSITVPICLNQREDIANTNGTFDHTFGTPSEIACSHVSDCSGFTNAPPHKCPGSVIDPAIDKTTKSQPICTLKSWGETVKTSSRLYWIESSRRSICNSVCSSRTRRGKNG